MYLSLFYDVGCYIFREFLNIIGHSGQVLGGVPVTLSHCTYIQFIKTLNPTVVEVVIEENQFKA